MSVCKFKQFSGGYTPLTGEGKREEKREEKEKGRR
jgi:hypothetical protein